MLDFLIYIVKHVHFEPNKIVGLFLTVFLLVQLKVYLSKLYKLICGKDGYFLELSQELCVKTDISV